MKRSLQPLALAVVLVLPEACCVLAASDTTNIVAQTSKEAQVYASAEFQAFSKAQGNQDVPAMLKFAQELVKAFPNEAAAHVCAGDAYSKAGLKKDALASYQHALQLDPKSYYAECGMGFLYFFADDATNALEHLEQAVKIRPESSQVWGMIGLAHSRMRNFRDAATALTQSVKLDATNSGAWESLGEVRAELDEADAAKAAYLTYYKLNPKLAEDYWQSWLAHDKEGLQTYLQKIVLSRRETLSDGVMGNRFLEAVKAGDDFALKADYANSIAAYQEAIRKSPYTDNGYLYGAIGFSYGAQGKRKEAIDAFRRSLVDHPNGGDGLAGLAILLIGAEQFSEARKLLDELIKIKTDPVWQHYGSMIRATLPRLEAASEVWRKTLHESTTPENRKDGLDKK